MRISRVCAVGLLMTGCPDDGQSTTGGPPGDETTTGADAGSSTSDVPTSGVPTSGAPTSGATETTADETATSASETATAGSSTTQAATTGLETTEGLPSCGDGVQAGDETDVDCGGSCPGCGNGGGCVDDQDCSSMHCIDGTCVEIDCLQDEDCAALGGPCAAGACEGGTCVAVPVADGTECDDLQVCTAGPASCMDGACVDLDGPFGQLSLTDVGLGTGGFVFEVGAQIHGASVALIPDFNGDGLADIAVGNSQYLEHIGRVMVVYGKPDTASLGLNEVAVGDAGFMIEGVGYDYIGQAVAGGDINGDGLGDLLFRGGDGNSVPLTYVAFGTPDPSGLSWSGLVSGEGGFIINPDYGPNGFTSVALGDINDDGLDDMVLGDYVYDGPGKADMGRTYVVFGKADTSPVHLDDVAAGIGGFVIDGEKDDYSGVDFDVVGDVNADGLADIVITALVPFGDPRSYVVFGKQGTLKIQLSAVAAGNGGFVVWHESDAYVHVRRAGDVNGDGLADILFGSPTFAPNGRGYVLFGKQDTATVHLGDVAAGTGGFLLTDFGPDHTAQSLAPAGDLDADGLADILVTTQDDGFVVFGKQDTAPVQGDALKLGQGGFMIAGEGGSPGMHAGGGLDANGDGIPDFVFGPANFYSPSHDSRTYLVFGGDCHP